MIRLRQSTASQEIPLGPFVDSTDGNTAETGLTIANTDIKVWKTGATTLANKNSGGATHISGGIYYAVLDAGDTDIVGPMRVFVHVAGALPVKVDCEVLAPNVFDALYGTSASATQADVGVIATGTAQSATSTTIVLASATSFADDVINGATIFIVSGTGAGQSRVITDYVGATDTATVDAWTTTPDNTSVYRVVATPPASSTSIPSVNVSKIGGQTVTAASAITAYAHLGTSAASTAQTGDTYALANGANGFANIKTDTAAIKTKTDFLPAATAGAAGGLFIAGSNAATTVNITGNLTGNVSGSVGSVTGNVGGNVVGSVASVTAAVSVTGDFSATMKSSITSAVPSASVIATAVRDVSNATPAVGSLGAAVNDAASAGNPWNQSFASYTTAGTFGNLLRVAIPEIAPGSSGGLFKAGSNAATTVNITGNITGNVSGSIGSVTSGVILTSGERADITTSVLTTAVSESYRSNGAAPTVAQALCELLAHHGEASNSGTTKTLKKFDHTTTAMTLTYNDATTPTSVSRAT